MPEEIFEIASNEPCGEAPRLPRLLIEAVINLLRQPHPSGTDLEELLDELERSLDRCLALRQTNGTYEDATLRAPWLTADAERLKQDWAGLQQSLHVFHKQVSRGEGSRDSLARRFDEFTERFLEYEAAEQNFLQAAFPAPEWTEQI